MGKFGGAVLVFFLTGTVFGQNNNLTEDLQWNLYDSDKDRSEFSQSNAAAFWSSFGFDNSSDLSPYLSYHGWIVGDPHPDNFALHFDGEKWSPGLSDFDDGGEGPFALDLIRYLGVINGQSQVMKENLIQSYVAGLCGSKPQTPAKVLSLLARSLPTSHNVDLAKKAFIEKKKSFFPMGRRMKQELKKFLPEGTWRQAVVVRRDRGGSAGLNRFWILLEEPTGRLRHFEFKKMSVPVTDLYQEQKPHLTRVKALQRIYWPRSLLGSQTVVSIFEQDYLLRERIANPLKKSKFIENPHAQFQLDQFWLQHLGWKHGQQPAGRDFCQKIKAYSQEFSSVILKHVEQIQNNETRQYERVKIENKSYRLFGDVRFRLQNRNRQDFDPRIQQKIRARFGSEFFINENVKSRFSVSTGRSPTSANANLGDSFSYKSFGIHEASIQYQHKPQLAFVAGKMDLPFVVVGDSEIVWDNTLTPEGVALRIKRGSGLWRPFLNLGYFMVEENFRKKKGIDQPDHTLFALQIGLQAFWRSWEVTLAGGPIRYSQMRGTLFEDIGEDSQSGNSSNGQDAYLYDFHMNEIFFELVHKGVLGLSVFAHAVENSASEENQAYRAGFSSGYGSLKWIYAYREVEKDSVLGYFTESNFAFGGTDQKGHEVSLVWKIANKFRVKLTQHWSQLGVDEKRDSMKRTHLDFKVKF